MKNFPTFDELKPLLETQLWAVYNPSTRLFSANGSWQTNPFFFNDQKTAEIIYSFLNPRDAKHSLLVGFTLSATHGIVPEGSTAPNIIEQYTAQRQARAIQDQLPKTKYSKAKRKSKL